MTVATQQVATGQIIRVSVPQWFRADKKLPSRELVGTVGRIFAKAYDFENVFAVVRQSEKCLRCDGPIQSPIMQRVGYCDACAPLVGAPAALDIDVMEWKLVKKSIHDATTLCAVTLPHEVSNVLDILRDAPATTQQAARPQVTRNAKATVAISINEEVDPSQHRVFVRGSSIYVECFGKYNKKVYDACKGIGGGKWSGDSKAWVFPARPVTASRVKNALSVLGLDVSDAGLQRLIDEAINADVALSIKNIDIKALAQPQGLRYPLWAHQLRAFSFAKLFSGCGLFMDMGTGKSLVTVSLLAERKIKTVLIVSPKSVIDVWEDELAKHAMFPYEVLLLNKPGMSTVKKVAAAQEAIARAKQRDVPVIIVTNYETAVRPPMGPKYEQVVYEDMYGNKRKRNKLKDPGFIASQNFDMIVTDEAHKLMNHTSLTSRVFGYFGPTTTYRLALTGTPLAHDPLNAWGIFRFVNPDVFPSSFSKFRSRYALMGGFQGKQVMAWQNLDELHDIVGQHSFQVTKEVLDLPPQVHSTRYGELGKEEQKHYDDMYEEFQTEVLDVVEESTFTGEMMLYDEETSEYRLSPEYQEFLTKKNIKATNVLAKLMKLSQIAAGFISDTEEHEIHDLGTSKLDLLAETMDEIDPEEPVVIFARFTHNIQAIKARMKKRGLKVAELSGKVNELRAWQRGEYSVLVVQVQSGGEGVNLTRSGDKLCKYCIYFSKDFNWAKYQQSLSRIHRPGQTETTNFIHLVMQGTVDETIEATLSERGNLVTAVLTGKALSRFNSRISSPDDDEEAPDETEEDEEDD